MKLVFKILFLSMPWASAFAADGVQSNDAIVWLQRIPAAARELNYTGIFIYQHGKQLETSRITHIASTPSEGEYEKLETLDGPPREIVRTNDQVICYYLDNKVAKVEKRRDRKTFPALLPLQLSNLTDYYAIRKAEQERIAGIDAQAVMLEPKDDLRYGHKFWADVNSGLLLKARMLNEKRETVEQFAFTQVTIGQPIDRKLVTPRYDSKDNEWKFERPVSTEASNLDTGWIVKTYPPGFKKIMETKRVIKGKSGPVAHLVFSDGLAAVSVFVEPLAPGSKPTPVLSRHGGINIYTRPLGENLITVLGEAPPVTVVQMGDSVSYKNK